jgi:FtsH-binding integral membrane protein
MAGLISAVNKNSQFARAMYYLVAGLLLVASGVSFNAAFANWFFADFHNENSRSYVSRGNIWFLLALIFLAGCIWLVIAISRSIKKSKKAT